MSLHPRCIACVTAYPDEADHESCAEAQIREESVPYGDDPRLLASCAYPLLPSDAEAVDNTQRDSTRGRS